MLANVPGMRITGRGCAALSRQPKLLTPGGGAAGLVSAAAIPAAMLGWMKAAAWAGAAMAIGVTSRARAVSTLERRRGSGMGSPWAGCDRSHIYAAVNRIYDRVNCWSTPGRIGDYAGRR